MELYTAVSNTLATGRTLIVVGWPTRAHNDLTERLVPEQVRFYKTLPDYFPTTTGWILVNRRLPKSCWETMKKQRRKKFIYANTSQVLGALQQAHNEHKLRLQPNRRTHDQFPKRKPAKPSTERPARVLPIHKPTRSYVKVGSVLEEWRAKNRAFSLAFGEEVGYDPEAHRPFLVIARLRKKVYAPSEGPGINQFCARGMLDSVRVENIDGEPINEYKAGPATIKVWPGRTSPKGEEEV